MHCVIERKHVRLHVRPEPLIFPGSRLDETRTAANSGQWREETSGRLSLNSFGESARERGERKEKSLSPLQSGEGTNRGRCSAAVFVLDQQIHFPNTGGKTTTKREERHGLNSQHFPLRSSPPQSPHPPTLLLALLLSTLNYDILARRQKTVALVSRAKTFIVRGATWSRATASWRAFQEEGGCPSWPPKKGELDWWMRVGVRSYSSVPARLVALLQKANYFILFIYYLM